MNLIKSMILLGIIISTGLKGFAENSVQSESQDLRALYNSIKELQEDLPIEVRIEMIEAALKDLNTIKEQVAKDVKEDQNQLIAANMTVLASIGILYGGFQATLDNPYAASLYVNASTLFDDQLLKINLKLKNALRANVSKSIADKLRLEANINSIESALARNNKLRMNIVDDKAYYSQKRKLTPTQAKIRAAGAVASVALGAHLIMTVMGGDSVISIPKNEAFKLEHALVEMESRLNLLRAALVAEELSQNLSK